MQGTTLTRRSPIGLVTVAGLLALAGCGGGESAFVDIPPGPMTQTEITGSVGDGPVTAASIVVTNNAGDILAEFQSDMSGSYNVTVEARDTHYPLLVSATGGTDLVTNMAPDFTMLGAAIEPGARAIANINPITTLIIEVARNRDGGITTNNIQAAEETVLAAMDTGLITMQASGTLSTPVDASNISEVVRAAETLAEIVRRTRDLLEGTANATNGDGIIQALGSDLVDGVVDGIGGPRSDARTAAVLSIVSAQVLLESMANELHVNGIDATEAMRAAIVQVSPGMPAPTLDELTVTAGMIKTTKLGISAAIAVDSAAAIAGLAAAVEGLQAGMDAALVSAVLPAGYRLSLDSTVFMVANGDDTVIEAVNSTVRNGGTPPPPANQAPTISGSPPNAVDVDAAYSFTPTASDADGDTLTFTVTNLPAWASFDTTTGALTGTPLAADAGSYLDIVIEVSDGSLSDSLGPFSINVVADNQPPVISGSGGATILVSEAYSFTPTASDPEGDPLTFSVTNGPSWASFDPATGTLSGTPAAGDAGTYATIIIRVSDGDLTTSLDPFTIAVTAPNTPPTIGGTPPSEINAGSVYSFTPTATDADGDTLTFSITGRPAWASFNPANGQLSGTPDNSDAGTHINIRITVSDGTDSATLGPFSITVTAVNTPPTIGGSPPAQVTAGSAYSFTPTANDTDGDTLTFSITGGPAWASFSTSNGRLSGTPGDADVGIYSDIRITVSDSTETATLGPFSITVNAVSLGSATLTWDAPTINRDGTPLTDLAAYKIYWGTTPGSYPSSVRIDNPGITTYVVENLAPGTYEFVSTAINSQGEESRFSNTATFTVQ